MRLNLDLDKGPILIEGHNGAGKSNLLEALYMMAVAKPHRSRLDRECINWDIADGFNFAEVSGKVKKSNKDLDVKILIHSDMISKIDSQAMDQQALNPNYKKTLTINGTNNQLSQFIGQVNVVLFDAEDMKIIYGPPATRRKFIDICVSQTDVNYFKLLQAYNTVLSNRNRLLKSIRQGNAAKDELLFWNNQLVEHGSYLIQKRYYVIEKMNNLIKGIFKSILQDEEQLEIFYSPNNKSTSYDSLDEIRSNFLLRLQEHYSQEVAQGFTVIGPHRDDIQMILNQNQVASYASRGQARSIALSFKLAQAEYIENTMYDQPIILLDDVLAELDEVRKHLVMSKIINYEQIILTTSDIVQVPEEFLKLLNRLVVTKGVINAN